MPVYTPALDLIIDLADRSAKGRLALNGSRLISAASAASHRIVRADTGLCRVRAVTPNLSGERAYDDVDLSISTVRIALGVPGSNPYCLATLATPLPGPAAFVTTRQSVTVDLPATKRITLDPPPYAGHFLLTLDDLDPIELPYDADADRVQALLGLFYAVKKRGASIWEISGTAPGQDIALAVDVSGLLVPLGVSGSMALNTVALAAAFAAAASGTPPSEPKWLRVTLEVEIDGVKVYQHDQVEIARELLNLSSLVPTPLPPSDVATINVALGGKQPIDADLTAIAALGTVSYGRGLLTLADAGALRAYASLQPLNAQLTAIAALSTAAYGRSLLTLPDAAAARAALGVTFANLAGKPTTIAGYGITDLNSLGDARWLQLANLNTLGDARWSPLGHAHSFTSLTGKPTTLAGYGITDLNSLGDARWLQLANLNTLGDARWSPLGHAHSFASLTGPPTTVAGYGITDLNSLGDARWSPLAHAHSFTSLTGKPTSLAGYGIADPIALTDTANTFVPLQSFHSIASRSISTTQLPDPGAPTVTAIGNDEGVTRAYRISAVLADGTASAAGPAASTTQSDETLDATHRVSLAWAAVPGAASYNVYRLANDGISPATIGKIANVPTPAYVDTGTAGDGSTPPATNATGNLTLTGPFSGVSGSFSGGLSLGGALLGPSATFSGALRSGRFDASSIGRATVYASSIATLDSNVLTGGGTDVTAALNALLDAFHLTGGGVLVLDGAALISAPLVVGDNTTIYSPNDSCGVYLATGSNSYMLKNRAITSLAPPPRPATYNKKIQIIGGTWNGNWAGQSQALANNISNFLTCGFAFAGVDNLVLDGLTILNARRFAALMAYLGNPTAQNLIIKWDSFHLTSNNDGLHFWGPITGTNTVRNIRGINGSDDLVALNYIESAWWSGNNDLFDDIPAAVNTLVDGVSTENSAGPVVLHGSSLDYRIFDPTIPDIDTSVGTITIRNLTADLNSTLHTGFALFASGRWDRLTVDNFKVKYPPTMPGLVAAYDRNVRIASYNPAAITEFSRWQVSGATDDTQPFILYGGNSTSHALTLNDFHVTRTLGSPTGSLLYLSSGTDPDAMAIDILNVRDCEITGYASLIFNGRPMAKLPRVYLDNNTLPPGATAIAGTTPASIVNGQFFLDTAGVALIPFVMSDIADIRPGGVPATVLWQQLSSLNFASVYGMRWQFNLSGYTNATQSRFSIAGGNNTSGDYTTADVLSLFSGGGVSIGASLVDPGPGNLALSGLSVSSFVKTNANKVLVSGAIAPSDLVVTTVTDNAPTGTLGEYISASRSSGSALSLTTGAIADVTSITLGPGDWDVEGLVGYVLGGGAVITALVSGSTYTSATFIAESTYLSWGAVDNNSLYYSFNIPAARYSLATTSTIYLIARGTFTVGTLSAYGTIRARRPR